MIDSSWFLTILVWYSMNQPTTVVTMPPMDSPGLGVQSDMGGEMENSLVFCLSGRSGACPSDLSRIQAA